MSGVVLAAEKLEKSYGDLRALKGISCEVRRGEIFAFLGPNGAGKTTLISIMSGLLQADSGDLRIFCRRGKYALGISPQNIVVWENLTCLEQLLYAGRIYGLGRPEARRRSLELLDSFGLIEKCDRIAKTLSGGMLRRLNIALALVHSPELLFLDEPQAGLDPQSRVLVRDYLRRIKRETTIVLTTHDMEEAEKLSDRVCIIDRGEILTIGTLAEVKHGGGDEDLLAVEIGGKIDSDLLPFLAGTDFRYELVSEQAALFRTRSGPELSGRLLAIVRERGLGLLDLRLRKKSLEDIFIDLTGRSLRE